MPPRHPLVRDRELMANEFVYDATTLELQIQVQFPEGPRMLPFAVTSLKPKWIDFKCAGCKKFYKVRGMTVGFKRLTGTFYCHTSLLDSKNHACAVPTTNGEPEMDMNVQKTREMQPNLAKTMISKYGIDKRLARKQPPSSSSSVSVSTADSNTEVVYGWKFSGETRPRPRPSPIPIFLGSRRRSLVSVLVSPLHAAIDRVPIYRHCIYHISSVGNYLVQVTYAVVPGLGHSAEIFHPRSVLRAALSEMETSTFSIT